MIYFDHNASSPPKKAHYKKVFDLLSSVDGNPSSIHSLGRKAKLALEEARDQIASLLGAEGDNILFTSGASEANNLALNTFRKKSPCIVIASELDHPSLKAPLNSKDYQVTFLKLKTTGLISKESLEEALKQSPLHFASLTYANGETGIINPVLEIADRIKELHPSCHVHVDAVQALGKIDLTNFHNSKIDSASFSAHKIGALKGVGCLYVKKAFKKKLKPLIEGGGQEFGLRAGTENLAGVISFAEATKDLNEKKSRKHFKAFKEKLLSFINENSEFLGLNTDLSKTIPNTFSLYLKKISMEKALLHFERRKILLSTKSACSSGVSGPSETLLAMGKSEHCASHSIRVSLASSNTLEEFETFLKALKELF